jgi:hypothetical protein
MKLFLVIILIYRQKYLFLKILSLRKRQAASGKRGRKILVNRFKKLDIVLSGGSTVKRHLLSPIHMRLSRFLLILEGYQVSFDKTIDSFQINNLIHSVNVVENFSKNKNIWKLRNAIKNTKKFNNEDIDTSIYLLNKIEPYFTETYFEKIENNPNISFEQIGELIIKTDFEDGIRFKNNSIIILNKIIISPIRKIHSIR